MSNNNIKSVLIVGGGTAGWMTAVAMSKFLDPQTCKVQLVESELLSTVGVGEATIPQIVVFNKTMGLDENEFLARTQGTFKLGIEFVNWKSIGSRYIHAFGEVGRNMHYLQFHHYWWKLHQQGKAGDIGDYTLNCEASLKNKFMRPVNAGNSPLSNIAYAFQFDAGLYASYLREKAEEQGVQRIEGFINAVQKNNDTGFIKSVTLSSGEKLEAEFFIDCSGFKGLLIEESLNAGYEDWTHWLPCDSAWAVPSERVDPLPPYTRATAHTAGWQWRIPLQHRTGNGHVFSSKYMDEERAKQILLKNLDGAALAEPKLIKFRTGKRKRLWVKNCVALGLASGFMEPLESTSIHLVQSGLSRLMSMFPTCDFNQAVIDEFNRQSDFEYESIRDFLILHYHVTEREDSEFWRYCKNMPIPETLRQKIELFQANGTINRINNELFNETSWLEVFLGQGLVPERYHPMVDNVPLSEIESRLARIRQVIVNSVEHMPNHSDFIAQNCHATK